MEYAAVIIPTLNRIKHLRRCVESLASNRFAEETDIYISVDYPPTDKYKEGYKDVIDYVKNIKGFSSVNVFYQDKNLGPGLNRKFLENKISEEHDKYVFTDDDNEFSPNFLAYINWGLEKYKNDERVYAICSCSDFDIRIAEEGRADYYAIPAYNPYGTGHWLHKNERCRAFLNQESLNHIYKSSRLQNILLQYSPMIYMWVAQDSIRRVSAMRGQNDSLTYIDIWENFYIIEQKMMCIKPTIPKSRNWGMDGSGVHANVGEVADYIPSDMFDKSDIWTNSPLRLSKEYEKKNIRLHREKFSIRKAEYRKARLLFKINGLFGNKIVLFGFNILTNVYHIFKKSKSEIFDEVKYG